MNKRTSATLKQLYIPSILEEENKQLMTLNITLKILLHTFNEGSTCKHL